MTTAKRELSREVMWAAIQKLYPKAKPDGKDQPTEKLAEALRKKFAKLSDDDLADCDACGEASPVEGFDSCPFCGEGGVADAPSAAAPAEVATTMTTIPAESLVEEEATMATKKTAKAAKKTAKKTAKKPKSEKLAKTAAKVVPLEKDPKRLAKLKEHLDESVKSIRSLQKDMVGSGYELGRELIKVFDEQSWKARGKFRSFKEWCFTEAGFTPQMAKNYMTASKEFDRDEHLKLGVSKLAIIARLPAADRKPVIKAAMEGADLKTVQAKVTERRRELLGGKRGPGRPPKSAATAATPASNGSVSVVVKPSSKDAVLSWFASAPNAKGHVALKQHEPGAWTFLDLGNGTFLRVALEEGKGGAIVGVRVRFERKTSADSPTATAAA